MPIVDVPVSFQQIFFIFEIERFRNAASGLKAVYLSRNAGNFIELRLGNRHLVNRSRADCAALVKVCAVVLFIGCVKEELVGDNRATELDTPAGLVVVLGFDIVALELVTSKRITAVIKKYRAKEFVTAGLGDGIDVAS